MRWLVAVALFVLMGCASDRSPSSSSGGVGRVAGINITPIASSADCLAVLNLSFDSDLAGDTLAQILGVRYRSKDQVPATAIPAFMGKMMAHPEWTPVKRALYWQLGAAIINKHHDLGFTSIAYRGSKGAYVFQGHKTEVLVLTLDNRVFRAELSSQAVNFDERVLDLPADQIPPELSLRELKFKVH
jgi:hypothetical protein